MNKKWLLIPAALALEAIAVGASNGFFASAVPVEASKVRLDSILQFVDEQGKTRLPKVHLVTMPYDGRIRAVELVEGSPVTKGQVVARLVQEDVNLTVAAAQAAYERLGASIAENDDSTVEQTVYEQAMSYVKSMAAAVAAAETRMTAGEAKAKYAQSNFERVRELHARRAKSDEEFDRAELARIESDVEYKQDKFVFRAMEAMHAATMLAPKAIHNYIERKKLTRAVLVKQMAEAKAHYDRAEQDKNRGAMTSEVDGVVLERLVSNEGRQLAGTVLLRIGQMEQLQVETDILSQDVVDVKPGDAAEVYGPAIGAAPVRAAVERIHPAGFTKVSSLGVEQQRVKVVLRLDPKDLARVRNERSLGVDYSVRVRIFTAQKERALVIPRSALFRAVDGGWRVFAVRKGKARLVDVTVGLLNDEHVEIRAGLEQEDVVVLAPETNLADGAHVNAVVPAE